MRLDRKITIIAGLVLVLLIAFSAVASPPPLPSSFYGTIGASGFTVPSGAKVSAWVGGVKLAEVPVFTADGATAFVIDVPGDIPETAAVEGGREGETIVFKVGGAPAPQNGVWHTGNYERRDLTVTAGADIAVSVDDGQDSAVPGTLLTYTLTVRNLGSQMAKGVVLTDTLPSTVTADSLDGGTLQNSPQGGVITWPAFDLEAGASTIRTVTVLVNLTLPVDTEAIVNDASVTHDGSQGLDPNPDNDSDQDSDALFLAPDFAISDSDLVVTPAQPAPGTLVAVNLTVRNPGFKDATGLVAIYNGRPYSGTVVASQTVTVAKQGSQTLTFSFAAGASTVVVSAAVDPDDLVDEVSEGNNSARRFLADVADLAIGIDNFLLTPAAARAGDAVAVSVTVRNGGRLAAANVPVEVFDGEPGFGGVSIFSTTIPSIQPGGNQSVSFSWTATEGDHHLTAVADLADTILEMFENNNQAGRDLRVPRAAGPDLTVPSVDISGLTQSPVTLVAGGTVRATIANTGDAAAGSPFAARLFEDRDGDGRFSAGDRELARQEMPAGLAASGNATAVFSVQGALEFYHPALWVEADADSAIAELKEDNNLAACFGGCEIPVPPSPGVTPVVEWYLGGMEVEAAPMVAQLSDDNGDGRIDSRDVPDVVFIAEDSAGPAVMARSGVDGTEVWTFRSTVADPLSSRLSHVAAADLDGDGVAEVLAAGRNGRLLAIDHHGQKLWASDPVEGLTFRWFGGPSVADLTGDGVPEIVLGRTVLSNTGRLIAKGTADRGRNYWYYAGYGYPLHGRADDQAHSIVADVDLDGRPEIVAGSTLYRLEGNQLVVVWERVIPDNLMPDGFTAVANLDTDPQAEIVYVSSGFVMVLNHDGSIAVNYRRVIPFSQFVQPNGWSGPPTIADLDGDGKPEILVAGATELVALRAGLGTYWRAPVFDVDAQTAATVFDLDGDGAPEVLYADQDNFYILNGQTGAVRHSRHITSKTANEYPVVADVDNDGQAEILVPSTTSFGNDDATTRGLHVLGNPGWRGTRPIWNQFSYHVTNVQLDGTVPSRETPSWQAVNTYRVNESQASRPHARPNATVGLPRVGAPVSTGAPIRLRVGNGGRGVLPAGTAVVLYAGEPAQNIVAAETKTTRALQPGEWQDLLVYWQRPGPAGAPATAVVDPQGLVEECDETDNAVGFGITQTVLPDLSVPAGGLTVQASPVAGQKVAVNVKVNNVGSAQAAASLIRLYDGPPSLSAGAAVVGEAPLPAVAPGTSVTVAVPWETLGAAGTHTIYAVADGADTVVEIDEENNQGSVEATLAAATKPDPSAETLVIDPATATVGTPVRLSLEVANRGTALPGGFVVAFRVNNAEVARVTSAEPFEAGGRRTVEHTLQTLSLNGHLLIEAKADPANAVAEQDETNNSKTGFLDVLGSGLVVTVRTDKVTYSSNQPVELTVTAQNNNASPRTPVLRVTIQDGAGQVLATVQNQAVTLPPGSSTSSFSWSTGATPAGPYAAVAELVENGSTVARGSAGFSISQDRMASAQLFADRSEYEPDQTVALTGRVRNTGVNASLTHLAAKLEIRNPGGTVVWTETRTIPLLSAGAEAEVDGNWPVSNAAPGVYTASLDVREQGGVSPQLAYAAAQVTVLASSQTGTGLTGDLTVSPSPAGVGTVLLARFTTRNAGNTAIPGLRLRLRLVRLSDGTDALLQELAWPLTQGEQKSGAVGIPTTGLAEGEYQAKLDAVLPTKTPTLASQDLTLIRGLSVRDVVVQEGDGGTATAVFEVALSSPSPVPVTVDYATSDGTAAAGSDYEATSGSLTFAPDETAKTVAVTVHGDTAPESDEVFLLSLSNPISVELADAQAIGEIEDEEGCASPNLLDNPGAEEGTLETDLPGWTPGAGGWTRRIADPTPIDGAASFATLAGETAELVQEVDLAPFADAIDHQALTFAAEGFLRSHGADTARGRMIVEYLDASGANVLDSYDSGELASPDAWRAVSDARTVPAGARRARVRLLASPGGTGAVFFDRLGLRSLGIPVLTAEDAEAAEGNSGTKPLQFRARMSCAGPGGATVITATAAGTAAAGTDYAAMAGTLTFTPEALVQTVDVAIHGDTIDEQDETLRMVFTGGTGVVALTPQVTGTILDDDGPVTVSVGDSTVTEGDSATVDAAFTVTLSDESGREVRVAWATANGTATPAVTGADFVPASGTVVFPPGTTSQTVTVQVKGDLLDEPIESFLVRLSSPVNATIGDGEGEGRIEDNDEVLIAVTDVRVVETDSGTTPAMFTVSLSVPSVSPVTVQYTTADGTALAPGDYAAASGTLTFAPGLTSQTVSVPVAGELVKEPEEVFFLRLANPANASLGRPEGAGMIADNDGILISVGDVTVREGNGGGTPAAPGNLSRAPGVTTRVSSAYPGWPASRGIDGNLGTSWFTTSGDAANRGTRPFFEVVLPNLATVTELRMFGNREFANGFDFHRGIFQLFGNGGAVLYDSGEVELPAPNRDLVLTFPAVEGVRRARFTATADESVEPGFAEFEVIGVLDPGTVAVVPIVLSKAATAPVTANFTTADGSAVAGADYQATAGTLFVPPGVTATDVVVPLVGDLLGEALETFELRLANATEAVILDAAGVVTIVDDDLWTLNGTANDFVTPGCVQLTPNIAGSGGSAWRTARIDLTQSFDKTFRVYLGTSDGGADGIVWTLQNAGPQALGNGGGFLGITGLIPSVGVEIDTWSNGGSPFFDPSFDHMSVDENGVGNAGHPAVQASATSINVEDGLEHDLRVVWNAATRSLDVHFDGSERLVYSKDIVSALFGGTSSVFYGFTGTCGSVCNLQYFCETELCSGTTSSPKISIGDARLTEGNAGTVQAIFPVTLSCPADHPVTVSYATADGTALAGSDYLAASGTVTFQPGETAKSVSVPVLGESLGETDETFFVDLAGPAGGDIRYGHGVGTIVSDDTGFLVDDVTTVEPSLAGGKLMIQVRRAGPGSSVATVRYDTADGTARAGQDYLAASGTLTFQAGETAKQIYISLVGDAVAEPGEQFFLRLSNPTNAQITDGEAVVQVLDDDDCPSPNLLRNGGGDEPLVNGELPGWSEATGTAWTNAVACGPAFVGPCIFGGNVPLAELRQDVDLSGFASRIDQGGQRFRFEGYAITVDGQVAGEFGRIVVEYRSSAAGPVLASYDSGEFSTPLIWRHFAAVTQVPPGTRLARVRLIAQRISRNTAFDAFSLVALGFPSLAVGDISSTEGSSGVQSAAVPVQLSCSSTLPVQVNYLTSDGTATAPSDYQTTLGTLVFQPGEVSKSVPVPVLGDTASEGNETFFLNLASSVNAGISDPQGQVTILDDEVTLKIADISVNEGNSGISNLIFKVTLSGPSTVPVTVAFRTEDDTATAGSDYTAASGTLVFQPGETSKDVTVQVLGDTEVEPNEKLYVYLDQPVNAVLSVGRGTGTIIQDDIGINVGDAAVIEGNAGTVNAVFPVTLVGSSTVEVKVFWTVEGASATAGADFVVPNPAVQSLTFAPGETRKTIPVTVKGDTQFETGELFYVLLSNPTGAAIADGEGQGTIADDDDCPSVNLLRNPSADEPLFNGNIPSWTEVQGTAWRSATSSPSPFAGSGYFSAETATGQAELRQDVDVSAFAAFIDADIQRFSFEGWVRSRDEAQDDPARIVIEYLATPASPPLATFDSGEVISLTAWQQVADLRAAPAGTRWLRVRLISRVASGSTADGYFDALVLRSLGTPTLAVSDLSLIEGDTGAVPADFSVTLACASTNPVTVHYATADQTATAPSDYTAVSGDLTFAPGETVKTVTVQVAGDYRNEVQEKLALRLSNAAGGAIVDGEGVAAVNDRDPGLPPVPGTDVTYTLDHEFELGALFSVDHDAPNTDQLQVSPRGGAFPYLWVAASDRGTIVKIHTSSGVILGEYSTNPDGGASFPNPSRTTVAADGSVWVGNRGESSVAHIGLPELGQCVDRNNNGVIETSSGYDNVLAWPGSASTSGVVNAARDECILHFTRVSTAIVRHVSATSDNNVWVSGWGSTNQGVFNLVSGETGEVLRTEGPMPCGGYGGLVDRNGVVWSASLNGSVLRWDPKVVPATAQSRKCIGGVSAYGLSIDSKGDVWVSDSGTPKVWKISSDGVTLSGPYNRTSPNAQGLAVDGKDDVWVSSCHCGNPNTVVSHFKNDGLFLGNVVDVPAGSTGVAVDDEGKIWTANLSSSTASRIDPNLGPLGADGVTPIGQVDLIVPLPGANPYNYSDMTGFLALRSTAGSGRWQVIQDAGTAGAPWGMIRWNTEPQASLPAGTSIVAEVRAADSVAGLGGRSYVQIESGVPFVQQGRYLQVRFTLKRNAAGESPVLSDLRIQTAQDGKIAVGDIQVTEGNGGTSQAVFELTLAETVNRNVTVSYTTADGTAIAGQDYTAVSGTVTFPYGTTRQTVAVPVLGDLAAEPDETFALRLSSPVHGAILDAEGLGTILNDDQPPVLSALKTAALQVDARNDGNVNPGDAVRYRIELSNTGTGRATSVVFTDPVPANTTLVAGSVTASAGVVEEGNPVRVQIGEVAQGASVSIQFDVKVDQPLPEGVSQISNQGEVRSTELPPVATDDPAQPGTADPTVTPVAAGPPVLRSTKVDSLALDADNNGTPSPGDRLRYEVTITNSGQTAATEVVFHDLIPARTAVVAGSVTASAGTMVSEQPVEIAVGDLEAGASVTIRFEVTIDSPVPAGVKEIRNQGMVASHELPTVLTDDPDLGGDADVTVTAITAAPVLVAEKTAALAVDGDADGDGVPSPGDTIEYLVTVRNRGNTSATAVVVDDPVPARTALVDGSVSASQGTVESTSPSVRVALGEIAGGESATVRFRVRVASPIPAGIREVSNQAMVAGAELAAVKSDDPTAGGTADPTVTRITAAPVLVVEKKAMLAEDRDGDSVASPGDTLLYRITIANRGNTPATGVKLYDVIDQDTVIESGSLQVSQGSIVTEQPVEATPGEIGAGETVTATFRVTVDAAFPVTETEVANQARVTSLELSSEVLSDDPETAAPADATRTPVFLTPSASIGDVTVSEDAGTASLTVTLAFASNREVRIDYATAGLSATAGVDFTAGNGTLVFAPGETTQRITVPIVDDLLDETDETFAVNLTDPVRSVLSDADALVTITDNDAAPVVTVSSASVSESAGTAELTVTLSAPSGLEVRVDYATADGTALAGADYTAANGTLTFPAGTTSLAISVPVTNDALDEEDETFQVGLSNAINVTVGSAGTVTIVDDDEAPSVSAASLSVAEGAGTAEVTVTLSAASGREIRVDYATADGTAIAGTDYTSKSATLTFPAGTTSLTVSISVTNDVLDEEDETFLVNLSNPVNVTVGSAGMVTITDDDETPSISVASLSVQEGAGNAEVTVTLSSASGRQVQVDYATADGTAIAGADYTSKSSTLTFPAGTTSLIVSVPVANDVLDEVDETFQINLSNPVNATIGNGGTVTLVDDDGEPSLSISDLSINEGDSATTAELTVTLSAVSGREVQVAFGTSNVTALAGEDYEATTGVLTIPAGTLTAKVQVQIVGDEVDELDEKLHVLLSSPVAATLADAEGEITVQDDDEARARIDDVRVAEGNQGTTDSVFTVRLTVPSDREVRVDYATAEDTATQGTDYLAATGTLTFAPGETRKTVTVKVIGDGLLEGNETFTVDLSNAVGAGIDDGRGTGTIVDDEACLSPNLLVNPGAEQAAQNVGTVPGWTVVAGAEWQTRGANPQPAEGMAYFYAGKAPHAELVQDVNVSAYADRIATGNQLFAFEGRVRTLDETPPDVARIVVEYLDASKAVVLDAFDTGEIASPLEWQRVADTRPAPVGTVWIRVRLIANQFQVPSTDGWFDGLSLRSQGTATVTIGDTTVYENQSGTRDAVFNVSLSCPVAGAVSVPYATADGTALAGSDYLAVSGTLTFPSGTTQKTIAVPVIGDAVHERHETFTVQLGAASSGIAVTLDPVGLGTILNDDFCARSPGFWKEHTEVWPLSSLVIGTRRYSAAEMLAFLEYNGPDASRHLARQLVATRLNLAVGSNPSIVPVADASDAFLAIFPPGSNPSGANKTQANGLKDQLDAYNNSGCQQVPVIPTN